MQDDKLNKLLNRDQWERENFDEIKDYSPQDVDRYYKNVAFKKAFGNRDDYNFIKSYTPEQRDSLLNLYLNPEDSTKNIQENVEKAQEIKDINSENLSNLSKSFVPSKELLGDWAEDYKNYLSLTDTYLKDSNSNSEAYNNSIKSIKDIAEEVSPYYKKYKDSLVTLSDSEWTKLEADYKAYIDSFGDVDMANQILNSAIKDNVSKNMPTWEKTKRMFHGAAASFTGETIATAGMFKGALDYFMDNNEDVEGLSGFNNFINSVVDNNWTRFGNDIATYGFIGDEDLEKAKELGLSDLEIVNTKDQEGSLINANTIFELGQSAGYMAGSLIPGAAVGKGTNLLFKGLKYAYSAASKLGGRSAYKIGKGLLKMQKAQNIISPTLTQGIVGTSEGVIEGLNTKQESYEAGINDLNARVREELGLKDYSELEFLVRKSYEGNSENIKNEIEERVKDWHDKHKNKEGLSPEIPQKELDKIHQEVFKEYVPLADSFKKYKESLDQIEFASSRAGAMNFLGNSLINGFINSTLKLGMMTPEVQKQMTNLKKYRNDKWNKLWGKETKPKFNVDDDLGVHTKPMSKKAKAWEYIKGMGGEGLEESFQEISDTASQAWASDNITMFLDNKYGGDGQATVGDIFSSGVGAYFGGVYDALTNFQTLKSGVYGALGAAMGAPTISNNRKITTPTGKSSHWYLGKGTKENGEKESTLDVIARLAPWQSSISGTHQQLSLAQKRDEETAKNMEEFLKNPKNKHKFDGLVGSINWSNSMQEAAEESDEFNYRNSKLGKDINDILMMQNFEGTDFYESLMNSLVELSSMQEDSEVAKQRIEEVKKNVHSQVEGKSDKEIFDMLKKNATERLELIDKVAKASESIDSAFGDIDEDAKQSFIFTQLKAEDLKTRRDKVNQEIKDLEGKLEIGKGNSELVEKAKPLLARFGSLEKARQHKVSLDKKLEDIKKSIKDLHSLQIKDPRINKALEQLRSEKSDIEEELEDFKILNDESITDEGVVLSEEEIMNLDPVSRAIMLKDGNKKLYERFHGTPEEIQNLEKQIEFIERKIKSWTDENGKVKKRHNKQVKTAKEQLAELQEKLDYASSKTKSKFSDAQQRVIDNLLAKGLTVSDRFFDDVVDLGRLEYALNNIYKEYNKALIDRKGFNEYASRAKRIALDQNNKTWGESMSKISNYQDFAAQYSKMLHTRDARTKRIIDRELLKTENGKNFLERYNKFAQKREDIVNFLEESKFFEKNEVKDADIIALGHVLDYLDSKGVDLSSKGEVYNALHEKDEEGKDLLESYLDEFNKNLPDVEKYAYVGSDYFYDMYEDIIDAYNKDATEKENNYGESSNIDVTSTTTTDNNPPVNPTAKSEEDKSKEKEKEVNINPNKNSFNDVLLNSISNKSKFFIDGIKKALEAIDKAPIVSSEDKQKVKEVLKDKLNNYEGSLEDLIKFLEDYNEEDNTAFIRNKAAQSIRDYINSVSNKGEEEKQSSEETKQLNMDTTNSGFMDSVNLSYILKNHSDSPLGRFIKSHRMIDFLRTYYEDSGIMGKVIFITDSKLTEEVKEQMGDDYNKENKLPIIGVVEIPGNIKAVNPIIINGKKYQPITILPSSDVKDKSGISNIAKIREAAQNSTSEDYNIIKDSKNNVLTGTFTNIEATDPFIKAREGNPLEPNSSIQLIFEEPLDSNERTPLNNKFAKEKKKTDIYKIIKERFLRMIDFGESTTSEGESYKGFRLNIPNLKKGSTNTTTAPIFITKVSSSKSINSGKTISELFKELNENPNNNEAIDDLLSFNSRIIRITEKSLGERINELKAFIDNFDASEYSIEESPNGLNSITHFEQENTAVEKLLGILNSPKGEKSLSKIDNSLNLESSSLKYQIVPFKVSNSELGFKIVLFNNGTGKIEKELCNITKETLSNNEGKNIIVDFLRNLIMDEDGTTVALSKTNKNFEAVKWQVEYPNSPNSNKDFVKASLESAYDDNILDASITSPEYSIKSVKISSPFDSKGGTVKHNEVANKDNATSGTPLNDAPVNASDIVTDSQGKKVDADTGLPIGEKPKVEQPKEGQEESNEFSINEVSTNDKPSGIEGKDYVTINSTYKSAIESKEFDDYFTIFDNKLYQWFPDSTFPNKGYKFFWKELNSTPAFKEEVKSKLNKSSQDNQDTTKDLEEKQKDKEDNKKEDNQQGNITPSRPSKEFTNEKETKLTEGQKKAKKVVDQIIKDGEELELRDDDKGYTDTKTNVEHARVTRLLSATEGGETFDEYEYEDEEKTIPLRNSKGELVPNRWILPSTSIGTGYDELFRDYFTEGKIINETNSNGEEEFFVIVNGKKKQLTALYPNANAAQLNNFCKSIKEFKAKLEARGLTVVPRDITISGTVEVTDNNGIKRKLNVAGTLDLLAYDKEGNFHIFDMKTRRSDKLDAKKKEKYEKQLSLYKKLLEDKYGIKVKSINIIPIKVNYPDPKLTNGESNYSLSNSKPNQLLLNGKEFKDAKPKLEEVIEGTIQSLTFKIDKLGDYEKQLLFGEESSETESSDKPVVVTPKLNIYDEASSQVGAGDELGDLLGSIGEEKSNVFGSNEEVQTTQDPSLQWKNLTDQEKKDLKAKNNWTEETWNKLSDEEKKHEKDCVD